MTKVEARKQYPDCVMFCNEGSFYTFYDIDAVIVNKLCGYKIIPVGQRAKAGVPLKNTTIMERLENDNISYIVFKNGSAIQKKFDASPNKYAEIAARYIDELNASGKSLDKFFCKNNLDFNGTGRNKGFNIPKVVQQEFGLVNTVNDEVEVRRSVTMAEGKKFNAEKTRQDAEEHDAEWQRVNKIPHSANDLIVITAVKKLGAYIIAVTEKSPAKFRGVFVNRMQNYCLDALEDLQRANFIHMTSQIDKTKREDHQAEAINKLKMLGYVAMIAESVKCILTRQYKQISIQLGEAVNLISAWRKSDDERWKLK